MLHPRLMINNKVTLMLTRVITYTRRVSEMNDVIIFTAIHGSRRLLRVLTKYSVAVTFRPQPEQSYQESHL